MNFALLRYPDDFAVTRLTTRNQMSNMAFLKDVKHKFITVMNVPIQPVCPNAKQDKVTLCGRH